MAFIVLFQRAGNLEWLIDWFALWSAWFTSTSNFKFRTTTLIAKFLIVVNAYTKDKVIEMKAACCAALEFYWFCKQAIEYCNGIDAYDLRCEIGQESTFPLNMLAICFFRFFLTETDPVTFVLFVFCFQQNSGHREPITARVNRKSKLGTRKFPS